MLRHAAPLASGALIALAATAFAGSPGSALPPPAPGLRPAELVAAELPSGQGREIVVSVPDQKLAVFEGGVPVAQYPISTSRFGLGDRFGSYRTPLGELEVASKIGAGARPGTVFKGRNPTREVLPPNAPGRDPIVTRILHLRGRESRNANAFQRGIYIHGTPIERRVGRPASYGCIRMKSDDVVRLFEAIGVGARVIILDEPLRRIIRETAEHIAKAPVPVPAS